MQEGIPFPLIVNQLEIHLGRLDCFYDGTLDQCIAKEITPLAWAPLGGGFLGTGGKIWNKEKQEHQAKIQQTVDEIAKKFGLSRTLVSLAWLLKHPSKIIPIIGSAKPENIREAVKADSVELDGKTGIACSSRYAGAAAVKKNFSRRDAENAEEKQIISPRMQADSHRRNAKI